MIVGVADTHAALWHLFDDKRLSVIAANYFERAAFENHTIAVSTISLAEIVYLIEKKRLHEDAYSDLRKALADPDHVLKEQPLSADIVESMRMIERTAMPDLPDRIVAATALHLNVPVISRDGRIRTSTVETVW